MFNQLVIGFYGCAFSSAQWTNIILVTIYVHDKVLSKLWILHYKYVSRITLHHHQFHHHHPHNYIPYNIFFIVITRGAVVFVYNSLWWRCCKRYCYCRYKCDVPLHFYSIHALFSKSSYSLQYCRWCRPVDSKNKMKRTR